MNGRETPPRLPAVASDHIDNGEDDNVTMHNGDELAALDALSDLVETAQAWRDDLHARRLPGSAGIFDHLAAQLDLVRARLMDEHDAYLPEAWAFVDAGRLTIAQHRSRIDRRVAHGWTR